PGGGASRSGGSTQANRGESADYVLRTQLFWIVSRANNCHYCLGHQESKLLNAGLSEDQIASLDGDWRQHTPAERAAVELARKITLSPHLIDDEDLARLKPHFSDEQIIDLLISVATNNATNRWKEGIGVPQSAGGFGSRRTRSTIAVEVTNAPH